MAPLLLNVTVRILILLPKNKESYTKRTIAVFLIFITLLALCACKSNTANVTSQNATGNGENITDKTQGNAEYITGVTDNKNLPVSTSTSASMTYFITASRGKITAEADTSTTEQTTTTTTKTSESTKKQKTTITPIYVLYIKYKNANDFRKKVSKYSTFSDLLKDTDVDKNNACVNPFRQENLAMIFVYKQAFLPILPDNYKFKSLTLCSNNYFEFIFTDDKKKEQSLRISTISNDKSLGVDKFKKAFDSQQGIVIYKNKSNQYCWYLNREFIVTYSGTDKDFINNLNFEPVYIK